MENIECLRHLLTFTGITSYCYNSMFYTLEPMRLWPMPYPAPPAWLPMPFNRHPLSRTTMASAQQMCLFPCCSTLFQLPAPC